jgi:hypothetical protein
MPPHDVGDESEASWERTSSVADASTSEVDDDEGIDEPDASVEIVSVTERRFRARNRSCRARPEARPRTERP